MGGLVIKLITFLIFGLNRLQILNFIFYTSICSLLLLLLRIFIDFYDIKKINLLWGVYFIRIFIKYYLLSIFNFLIICLQKM